MNNVQLIHCCRGKCFFTIVYHTRMSEFLPYKSRKRNPDGQKVAEWFLCLLSACSKSLWLFSLLQASYGKQSRDRLLQENGLIFALRCFWEGSINIETKDQPTPVKTFSCGTMGQTHDCSYSTYSLNKSWVWKDSLLIDASQELCLYATGHIPFLGQGGRRASTFVCNNPGSYAIIFHSLCES